MLNQKDVIRLMDEMIDSQKKKVLKIAQKLDPHLTEEDLRNPHDFSFLESYPHFHFEDGILSGLISARTALLAEIRRKEKST